MKYLKIQNNGILDPRLISLMGGTTKNDDNHKIGQFGTGLKYVLAYMIRNGLEIHLYIDGDYVAIGYEEETISGELFKIITINGRQTSVTDRMGLTWEPWMIVRELYSNALDEGGAIYAQVDAGDIDIKKQQAGKTTFYLQLTPQFMQVFNDWNKYFIVNSVPMYKNDDFALHPTSGHLKLYKQGIMIYEDVKSPALFSYDLARASINELRQYQGTISNNISEVIFNIDDPQVVQYFIEHVGQKNSEGKSYFEAEVDLEWWQDYRKMNKAWMETIGSAKVIHEEAKQKLLERNPYADLDHTICVPRNLYKSLTRCFEGIGALRMAGKANEFYEVIDEELSSRLRQCLQVLSVGGYDTDPEINYIFGEFSNTSTLARVQMDKKEVMVSTKMKDKSTLEFCAMLVEENEHLKTGYSDHTREFQTHFIQLYTATIMKKGSREI